MFFRRDNNAKVVSFSVLVLLVVVALSGMFMLFPMESVSASFSGSGSGTAGDPYEVTTWGQLQEMNDFLSSHFVLLNDLDSSTTGYSSYASSSANAGAGWNPIGLGEYFTGYFDGQNFTISDLVIDRAATDGIGLFGLVDKCVITNVGLVDAVVTGKNLVGSLIGYAHTNLPFSIISNCFSIDAVVTGAVVAGGLVGQMKYCTVNTSFSRGAVVSGTEYVGGLIGYVQEAYVNNSYSIGGTVTRLSGTSGRIGGFTGDNYQGKIFNSYSTNSVHYEGASNPTDKGFAGAVNTGGGYNMSGNFWDNQTSGQTTSVGIATGLNTVDMMDIATFQGAGWDIVLLENVNLASPNVWYIWDGEDYPRFWYEYNPPYGTYELGGLNTGSPDYFYWTGVAGQTVTSTDTMIVYSNTSGGTGDTCTGIFIRLFDTAYFSTGDFVISVINTSDGDWDFVTDTLTITSGYFLLSEDTWTNGVLLGWAHGTNPFPITDYDSSISVRITVSIPAAVTGTHVANDWSVMWRIT